MNFEEMKKMIRRRLPSILAFAVLLIGTVVFLLLGIKTAFIDMEIMEGGGYKANYAVIFSGFTTILALIPALLSALSAGFMIPRLAGGGRRWLIVSLVFCLLSAAAILLLPGEVRDRMYFHEFLAYRYSFMHQIFYTASRGMDFFIASLKLIPHMTGVILITVGLLRERDILG